MSAVHVMGRESVRIVFMMQVVLLKRSMPWLRTQSGMSVLRVAKGQDTLVIAPCVAAQEGKTISFHGGGWRRSRVRKLVIPGPDFRTWDNSPTPPSHQHHQLAVFLQPLIRRNQMNRFAHHLGIRNSQQLCPLEWPCPWTN